ncbi:MAG: ABC transporter ATP-binding protein/permease [Eubacteriaceae bacterium]|nr:ABC transporter ATP-binding protein/permease [Eubacteriaceae bacterium]
MSVRGAGTPVKGPKGAKRFLTQEEKENRPKVTKGLLLRIASYMKPYLLQFAFVFCAIVFAAYLGLLPAYYTGRIVDAINTPNIDIEMLLRLLATAFGIAISSQSILVIEKMVNSWISQNIIHDMKSEMYGHLQYMHHGFFASYAHGDIVTRMTSDIEGVNTVITGTLSSVVNNVAIAVTALAALIKINWILALFGVIAMPLLYLPNRLVGEKKWKRLTERQRTRDAMNSHIGETLSVSGSQLMKLYAKEEAEYSKFVQMSKEVTRLAIAEQRIGKWFDVLLGVLSSLSTLAIYGFGGILLYAAQSKAIAFGGAMTIGTITYTVQLLSRLYRPVQALLNVQVEFTRSLALFVRIFDYLDMQSDVASKEGAISPDFESRCDIVFDSVWFSYSENSGEAALKDICFELPTGMVYAIVGPSGAGKSTIANLIPRLYDASAGAVMINGINVADYSLSELRANIGIVSQETYLFNDTILENLRYANSEATIDDIDSACKAANIYDFVMSLPLKYETVVGNRGMKLSGGEKQRLSIARVLLKDPKILIFDEATSSLDSIAEDNIQQALEIIMAKRTSIVIAHRLTTILAADRILVIDSGRIVEQGRHSALIKANGVYKNLYETQFKRILEKQAANMPAQ